MEGSPKNNSEILNQDDLINEAPSMRASMIEKSEDVGNAYKADKIAKKSGIIRGYFRYLIKQNAETVKETQKEEEPIVLDKPKDPKIKVEMVGSETLNSEDISFDKWIELQEYLKNNLANARLGTRE